MSEYDGKYRSGGVVDIQVRRPDGRTQHTLVHDEHAAPTTDRETRHEPGQAIEAGEHTVTIQTGE